MTNKENKYDFGENEYTARIRMKPKTLEWIKANKGKNTAAGFLEDLIKYVKSTDQFKKKHHEKT
jgi:hypothetical protein